MGSFLTSLTSIGSQAAEAHEGARQEKEARANKIHQMDVEDAYLQIAKQAEARQQESQEAAIRRGQILKIGGRLWDVTKNGGKGGWIDTQEPDPMVSLREFIKTLPPDVQKGASARAEAVAETEPNDPKAVITEVMRYADAQQAEHNRREDMATREQDRRTDAQTRETERREDKRESARANERLQKMMVDFRLAEKQKYMTPQERQMYDSIKIAEPMVDRLTKFIEDNHLEDQNAYVFGDHSALMQHLRFYGYKKGVEPEKVSSQLIKDAAALKVMGARPWMSMGRGKYLYEDIVQHLPQPTDTPQQLYTKVSWLRDNVLRDAKDSLSGYVEPGGAQSPVDIDKVLDQTFGGAK